VFLCHNSEDKPAVREISKKLADQNIKAWLDEDEIGPGTSWQTALGQQIGSIKSAAVFVGESGLGPWQDQEIQALLSQFVKRQCPVIPAVLPSAKATPELPWTLANLHWVDLRVINPDPFEQLIWGITGQKPRERSEYLSPHTSEAIPHRRSFIVVALLSRTHTSGGHRFAWADAESGMQTRHDPLACGVRYWEILTDQNSSFKNGGRAKSAALKCVSRSRCGRA
jgi:hypothetical protein